MSSASLCAFAASLAARVACSGIGINGGVERIGTTAGRSGRKSKLRGDLGFNNCCKRPTPSGGGTDGSVCMLICALSLTRALLKSIFGPVACGLCVNDMGTGTCVEAILALQRFYFLNRLQSI